MVDSVSPLPLHKHNAPQPSWVRRCTTYPGTAWVNRKGRAKTRRSFTRTSQLKLMYVSMVHKEVTKERKSGAAPLLRCQFPFDVVLITTTML